MAGMDTVQVQSVQSQSADRAGSRGTGAHRRRGDSLVAAGHDHVAEGGAIACNVNSFEPPAVYADASIYRPRFLRAPIC